MTDFELTNLRKKMVAELMPLTKEERCYVTGWIDANFCGTCGRQRVPAYGVCRCHYLRMNHNEPHEEN